MAVNLVAGLLTARFLGPENYGLIHYAAAYTGFFTPLCTLGINTILVKEFTDTPHEEGEILGTALILRGISSLLSAAAICCIVYGADRGDSTVMAVVCLCNVGMLFQIFDVFRCWFQSRSQSSVTAMVTLAAYLLTASYKLMLLWLKKDVVWFAFASAVDSICIALFYLIAYRKYGGGTLCLSRKRGRELLQKSCHFILPGLMVAIYAQTDKFMLKHLISESEIGYYSTAVSLCNTWCFVLSAIIDASYPEITRAHKTDPSLFNLRNRQLYAVVFYLSLAASALITLLAKPLVLLLYGESYLPAAAPLRVITWYTAFSYLGVARNAWIVCENRQRHLIWVYAAAAVSNVLLNRLCIPLWGATGAAAASLAAQIIAAAAAPLFVKGLRENALLMLEAITLKNLFVSGAAGKNADSMGRTEHER